MRTIISKHKVLYSRDMRPFFGRDGKVACAEVGVA